MPMPIYQSILGTTNGTSIGTPVIMDWAVVPFNASFSVEVLAGGTVNYGVQYTLNNPNAATDGFTTSTTVTWWNDANAPPGQSNGTTGNYAFPVQALKCVVSSATATTVLRFTVLQGLPNY